MILDSPQLFRAMRRTSSIVQTLWGTTPAMTFSQNTPPCIRLTRRKRITATSMASMGQWIYHPSVWSNIGCGESSHDLLLGTNLQSGTRLTIQEFDIEDAASGTTFANVYHAKETNAGYTSGYVSWGAVRANVGTSSLANFFDGGGGTNFIQNGFGHPFSIPGTNLGVLAY